MNTTMLRRVRQHFVNDLAPRHVQRHNMRAWIISIRMLGKRWLLAEPIRGGNAQTY